MKRHRIVKYMDHRIRGWGWWEQPATGEPIRHGDWIEEVIASLEAEGWEVAGYAAIPWEGGDTETLIFKRSADRS